MDRVLNPAGIEMQAIKLKRWGGNLWMMIYINMAKSLFVNAKLSVWSKYGPSVHSIKVLLPL